MSDPTSGGLGARYRIALVCLGNICRSPTADVVLRELLDRAGLDERVEVASCGTGHWHVGEPMDTRAAAELRAAGYDPDHHRARQFGPQWHDFDLILAMDRANREDLLAMLPEHRRDRVQLFRSYDPLADPGEAPEVPDPWYGGPEGFAAVLAMVERTAAALVEQLADGTPPR